MHFFVNRLRAGINTYSGFGHFCLEGDGRTAGECFLFRLEAI